MQCKVKLIEANLKKNINWGLNEGGIIGQLSISSHTGNEKPLQKLSWRDSSFRGNPDLE